MEEDPEVKTLTPVEVSELIGKIVTVPSLGMAVLAITYFIRLIHKGSSTRYWIILIGSLLSIVLLFAFNFRFTAENGKAKRGLLSMALAFSAFIPYLFGCYLFFFEGLRRLYLLLSAFSFRALVRSLLFTGLGYMVVNAVYKSTVVVKKIRG